MDGIKTYAIVVLGIIAAIFGLISGDLTLLQASAGVGLAIALGGTRSIVEIGAFLKRTRIAPTETTASRIFATYVGAGLAVICGLASGFRSEQPLSVTIGIILLALGIQFLALATRKAAIR